MIDDELRQVFRDEVSDGLNQLIELRDGWENIEDAAAAERILAAFRVFHNLKGAARLAGFDAVEPLAHAAEELLKDAHTQGQRPATETIESLVRAVMAMLGHAEGRVSTGELAALVSVLQGASAVAAHDGTPSDLRSPPIEEDATTKARSGETVRVRASYLDRLIAVTSEIVTHHARLSNRRARLDGLADSLRDAIRGVRGQAREALVAAVREVDDFVAEDRADAQQLGYVTVELVDAVRSARMLPLAGLIPEWRRVIEEAATKTSRRARLDADVSDVALDRRVLEGLRDPMMHLLRNAVDHGLEDERERLASGKPPIGTITVRAQAEGPSVVVSVADDGRGVDVERVLARAVERGVLAEGDARDLTPEQARDLVFSAGLSTASQVTALSGRGIGLDIARSRLRDLGGRIELHTSEMGGAQFRLSVPVDVVSTAGLLARVGGTIVAMPMARVERTQRIAASEVQRADGGALLAQPGAEPLRLLWLGSILGEAREQGPATLTVVVVAHGTAEVGLVVGEVLGETEFVVKPLPWNLVRVPGVAGAAVLGDGSLASVLDVDATLASSGGHAGPEERALERPRRSILVADDSVTSRILLRNILDAAGYETEVASDGEEAWGILQRRSFDLVVTDIQMPRLDGLELTRRVRKDARLRTTPVIVVTSLDRPEDIELGSEAGADEYIVKGRFDHRALLEAVGRLL